MVLVVIGLLLALVRTCIGAVLVKKDGGSSEEVGEVEEVKEVKEVKEVEEVKEVKLVKEVEEVEEIDLVVADDDIIEEDDGIKEDDGDGRSIMVSVMLALTWTVAIILGNVLSVFVWATLVNLLGNFVFVMARFGVQLPLF